MNLRNTAMSTAIDLDSRYTLACQLAREAGELAMQMFRNRAALEIEHKGLQDVVSIADREVENLIHERLREMFPEDAFLGEESAANATDAMDRERVVWIVDPIDGTSCFLNGMHAWCVSIGVLIDGEPSIGAVFDPNSGELFHAALERGAYVNDEPIRVSDAQSLKDGVLGVGFSHRVTPAVFVPFLQHVLEDGGMFIRNGSGALMIAYVAAGRLIGYYEPHINSWDCMAGIVLVREAGGVVNDFLSEGGLTNGNVVIAAGPAIYPLLAAHVRETTNELGPLESMGGISPVNFPS